MLLVKSPNHSLPPAGGTKLIVLGFKDITYSLLLISVAEGLIIGLLVTQAILVCIVYLHIVHYVAVTCPKSSGYSFLNVNICIFFFQMKDH